jgi:multidrug efflux pump subunit AcrB
MTHHQDQSVAARPTATRVTAAQHRHRSVTRHAARTSITAAVLLAAIAATVAACGGNGDGPASFLSKDDTSAIFVQWTRTGDDVSGTLSTAEVTQPQAKTEIFSTAPPPGQIQQQTGPFTGTVRDDSVRLLIGSGTQTNRVNGRLDGDTLELTIPQEQGVLTRRLKPAGDGDYTDALQNIRVHEQQRKAAAKAAQVRKQRADKIEITRVATAFQKALSPASSDDPCRYVTSKVTQNVRGFDFGSGRPSCTKAIRDSDAESSRPVSEPPLGIATITFGPLPPLTASFDSGPDGAVVTWRPKPDPDSLVDDSRRTMFIEQNGRWLVYRCCP